MDDYIRRKDLLDLYDLGGLKVENAKVPLNVVIQNIKDMPSADVVSREDYEGLELVCKNYEEALKDAVDELEESDRNEFGYPSCSVCHCGKGKWELVSTTKLYESGLYVDDEIEEKCSLCGCHTFRYETQKENNFCPNCGADMRHSDD